MTPANEVQKKQVEALYEARVRPDIPGQLCDDEECWKTTWRGLRQARRQRLLDRVEEMGLDPNEYRRATRVEIVAAIENEQDAISEGLDPGGWTVDDDAGYGPYSYFAHAMAKDD
jgi:hypothetical protein